MGEIFPGVITPGSYGERPTSPAKRPVESLPGPCAAKVSLGDMGSAGQGFGWHFPPLLPGSRTDVHPRNRIGSPGNQIRSLTVNSSHAAPSECPLFECFTPGDQEILQSHMRFETYKPRTDILLEDHEMRGLWLIRRGRCQVIKGMPDGSSSVLAELGAGAIFGEMSFFCPVPNSATVRSIDDVEACMLSIESYQTIEETSPRVAQKIALAISIVLAERMREMDDWVSRLLANNSGKTHQEWAEFRAKLYTNWDF